MSALPPKADIRDLATSGGGPMREPDLLALYLIDRRALARSVRGFVPVHRRNACVKFATSEYPKSHATSEIDMSLSAK